MKKTKLMLAALSMLAYTSSNAEEYVEQSNETQQESLQNNGQDENLKSESRKSKSMQEWSLQEAIFGKDKTWKRNDIATVPKFGGYIIGSYKYDDSSESNKGDGFGLRLVRL